MWEAFTDLSASRQSGFDVNPISFHDILSWVEMMGVTDSDDRQELVFLLRVMDSSWVEWARKKTDGDSTTGDRRNKG